jgi:hypothetical protein
MADSDGTAYTAMKNKCERGSMEDTSYLMRDTLQSNWETTEETFVTRLAQCMDVGVSANH